MSRSTETGGTNTCLRFFLERSTKAVIFLLSLYLKMNLSSLEVMQMARMPLGIWYTVSKW